VITGRATADGTRRFAKRSASAAGHFRTAGGLTLSSIGLGTYLGGEDAATDAGYESSVAAALASGINVFDTAINYRGQRSERAVGRALARAFAEGRAARDEVFVSTKGGYLPHDAEDGSRRTMRRYVADTFVSTGIAPEAEIAQGCHCIAPGYLADQIERSRRNLGLATIDLYYLHNVEAQLGEVGEAAFRKRLAAAVEALEEAAADGRIGAWGLATWDGLRVPPEHPEHLSLTAILALAREVAGDGHHFLGVQLPFNLAMGEALGFRSQKNGAQRLPALEFAREAGLAAFGSASILQGRLAGELPEEIVDAFPEARSAAQQALQFSRSAPGMTSALVGVSDPEHADEDFALAKVAPAEARKVLGLFS
jgi:aryl-alcohol dehydrogenase-like predicted oxidoreductase